MNFLQNDTFLTRMLSRLADMVVLSVLWFVCSIPVFTLGAATTALYSVTLEMALGGRPGLLSSFFPAFKRNFFRATAVFLVLLAAGLFIAADLWCALHWDVPFQFALEVLILSGGFFYLLLLTHAFPALAFYEGKPFQVLRTVFLQSLGRGIYSVFVAVVSIFPLLFLLQRLFDPSFGQWLALYLLVGSGTVAYVNSLQLARFFDPDRAAAAAKDTRRDLITISEPTRTAERS